MSVTIGSSAYSYFRGQLAWLSEQNWDPVLVCTPDPMAHKTASREGVKLEGVSMERGISPLNDVRSLINWFKVIKKHQPHAVSAGTPKASLLAMIASSTMEVPRRLYVVRGLRLEGASRPLSWILWTMEYLTMRMATDVFFVSQSLAEECKRRGLYFPKKSWLIGSGSSNGVDHSAILQAVADVDRHSLRTSLGLKQSDFVVGFVGRINRDKGMGQILEALQSPKVNSDVKVLAVGDLEDDSLVDVLEILKDRVVTTGWKDDVWKYFLAMDVLCLPTKREGFPNVVLEAGILSVPTITTFATGAVDSVVPEVTGLLVNFGNVDELAQAICRLSNDRELLENLGEQAKNRAISEFSPVSIWSGLDEILRGEYKTRYSRRFR